MDPREAIERGLHVGGFRTPLDGPGYRRPREVLPAGTGVVVRDSDCEPARTEETWTLDQWYRAVERGGLWRRVGMWDFVPWEDPAASLAGYAHMYPTEAGRRIHRLEERLRRLEEWVLPLYDEAILAEMEIREFTATEDYCGDYTEADLTRAALRRERIRRWLPGGGGR